MNKESLFKISYGLYVVSTRKGDQKMGCINNAFLQLTDAPVSVLLGSNKDNQTTEGITNTGEFIVSVLHQDVDPFIISNFGFQSGRTADKWSAIAYEEKDGIPYVKHALAYFHCKVTQSYDMLTHKLFHCTVSDAWDGEKGTALTYQYYQDHLKERAKETFLSKQGSPQQGSKKDKWVCKVCGYVYDGDIPFDQLPVDWKCPWCQHGKSAFEKM